MRRAVRTLPRRRVTALTNAAGGPSDTLEAVVAAAEAVVAAAARASA